MGAAEHIPCIFSAVCAYSGTRLCKLEKTATNLTQDSLSQAQIQRTVVIRQRRGVMDRFLYIYIQDCVCRSSLMRRKKP
jgi:hypothetical protein